VHPLPAQNREVDLQHKSINQYVF